MILSEEGTTQGDPLAMPMYAIGVVPLIREFSLLHATQVWFADDATGSGKLARLKDWWALLNEKGPNYGYFPKAVKTCLLVKASLLEEATKFFGDSGMQIETDSCRLLGAALGSTEFLPQFMHQKINSFAELVLELSSVARSQPHAAYAALMHGLMGKWTFPSRTMGAVINQLLQPLEKVIRQQLIPTLTDCDLPSHQERRLLALPVRLGGLGIKDLTSSVMSEYENSQRITSPPTKVLLEQCENILPVCSEVSDLRAKVKLEKRAHELSLARELREEAGPELQHSMLLAGEKGASNWLSALPLQWYGFTLYKSAFRDALCLRYGWLPTNLPDHCVCGQGFSVDHALSCSTGGIPFIRHNSVRDLTADLLGEVCHDVVVGPRLQPLSGESLVGRT